MNRAVLLAGAVALIAPTTMTCARPAPTSAAVDDSWMDDVDTAHPLDGYRADFVLTWNGARIGDAVETLASRGDDALVFTRAERVSVTRGGERMDSSTDITIVTDLGLRAREVRIRQQVGDAVITGSATRDHDGDWLVHYGDEAPSRVSGDVVPAELAPLLVSMADDRRLEARVMMPGYGFARGELTVEPVDGSHGRVVVATLDTGVVVLRGRMTLKADGTVSRVIATDAVGSFRTTENEVAAAFDPPEVVDTASIAIVDAVPEVGALALVIEPVTHPVPATMPGQRIESEGDVWRVELSAAGAPVTADASGEPTPDSYFGRVAETIVRDAGARTTRAEVTALVLATDSLLDDDYGATSANPRASLALGRGDCTTHATVFAALATARGIPTRIVTGFRIDGQRMVRHRWALAAVNGAWIAVDPTYGEVPARPRLLGLATSGATAAELAVIDDAAFVGFGAARARLP